MNRLYFFLLFFVIFAVVSCSNKVERRSKINLNEYGTDYAELLEKYSDKPLTTCNEALDAGEEIAKLFFETADKAFSNNDAKALSDLEHFGDLFDIYQHAADSLYSTCPEDFDKWEKRNRQKIEAITFKIKHLDAVKDGDTLVWDEDVFSEIEAVNEQVEQLKIDVQMFENSDSTSNIINA